MNHYFSFDTDEERLALLARARKIALTALNQYDLEWERIQFIQLSDTITYKIETASTQSYLLRIHSDRLSKEEIHSELVWLKALNKSDDLTVPEGVASCDGSVVLEIDTDSGYRRPYVTMMRWIEGKHASVAFTDSSVLKMGVLISKFHDVAGRFEPSPDFVRPIWGADSFRRAMDKLEKHYICFLSGEEWSLYQAASDKILVQLATMTQNNHNYGIIHADLHTGNMVFIDDQPYVIDFGRCGFGYYLYDMASRLLGLNTKQRLLLIQGYEKSRILENGFAKYLECFFVMILIENYSHHCSDPRETTGLIQEQPHAQAYIKKYLDDSPFLFDAIVPV